MLDQNLFRKVIVLLSKYQQVTGLNVIQKHILSEVITRLRSAENQYDELIKLNMSILNEDPKVVNARKYMTTEKITELLQKQAKKDPKLAEYLRSVGGKLDKVNSLEMTSFNLTSLEKVPFHRSQAIKKLHSDTETYYQNLWLINQKLNQLPRFEKFKPKGVREVRNQLIEHTDRSNSGASILSFGISTKYS